MEARIKQERLDRWNRIKQMPLSDESKELSNTPEKFVPGLIEPRCTDSGQFDMRSKPPTLRSEIPFDSGVVFKKVVHDPNFNYRILKENGQTLLHVNQIYKVMYPNSS